MTNLAAALLDRPILHGDADRPAVLHRDGEVSTEVSLRDLAVLSNRAAFALRGLGVVPGDLVLVDVDEHPSWLIALLGCARLGGVAWTGPLGERTPAVAVALEGREAAAREAGVREVLIADGFGVAPAADPERSWTGRIERAPDHFRATATGPDDALWERADGASLRHRFADDLPSVAGRLGVARGERFALDRSPEHPLVGGAAVAAISGGGVLAVSSTDAPDARAALGVCVVLTSDGEVETRARWAPVSVRCASLEPLA